MIVSHFIMYIYGTLSGLNENRGWLGIVQVEYFPGPCQKMAERAAALTCDNF